MVSLLKVGLLIALILLNIAGGLGIGLPMGIKKISKKVPWISGSIVAVGDIILFGSLISINFC